MLSTVLTILLVVPWFVFGQQQMQGAKTPASAQITCPKISCHLHHNPSDNCQVQTFFVYHGIQCEGCVEDACLVSQNIAHSGMSLAHSITDAHNHPAAWNRFLRKISRIMDPRIPNRLRAASLLFGHNQPPFRQQIVNQFKAGPGIEPACPEIQCHLHHQPDEHCVVETYFLQNGRRCTGCTEDICLGAHSVSEALIGKNEKSEVAVGGQLPIHRNPQDIPLNLQQDIPLNLPQDIPLNLPQDSVGVNGEHFSARGKPQNVHPNLQHSADNRGIPDFHSNLPQERIGVIGDQFSLREHLQITRPNPRENKYDSPRALRRTINSNRRINLHGNPSFRARNSQLGHNLESHDRQMTRKGSDWRTNDRLQLQEPIQTQKTVSKSWPSPRRNRNIGAEGLNVFEEKPAAPISGKRGIKRYSGKARSYLSSLFHPSFSR